jgi:hypothetical protein
MTMWRTKRFQVLAALFAFAVFGGYLVADSVADAVVGCAVESSDQSGGDEGCAFCFTCSHGGAVLPLDSAAYAAAPCLDYEDVAIGDERALDGPPTRIDHPPQLS